VFPARAIIVIPPSPPGAQAWEVGNYGGTDFGELTLRQATAFSVNVVYAQLMEQVGPATVARLAEAAGVRRTLPPRRSLALGAVEVTPLELASVQATLAAGGVYREPTAASSASRRRRRRSCGSVRSPTGSASWTRRWRG
jgi:membrane peptidoglycan carboxypeptidase